MYIYRDFIYLMHMYFILLPQILDFEQKIVINNTLDTIKKAVDNTSDTIKEEVEHVAKATEIRNYGR